MPSPSDLEVVEEIKQQNDAGDADKTEGGAGVTHGCRQVDGGPPAEVIDLHNRVGADNRLDVDVFYDDFAMYPRAV